MSMTATPLAERDPALYLQLASQAAEVVTHADLWRWLDGGVQHWLPHDALVVGWGDFDRGVIEFDIVSSMPGLRTADFTASGITPLLRYLRDCWVAARRTPCEVSLTGGTQLVRDCSVQSLRTVASLRSALVHGVNARADGRERIFAALRVGHDDSDGSGQALKVLLPLIDSALHRITPHASAVKPAASQRLDMVLPRELSEREREIMHWVALGKTNPEIGCILSISEFTVKNHLKSIFAKLDVTNRAQAVARITRESAHA